MITQVMTVNGMEDAVEAANSETPVKRAKIMETDSICRITDWEWRREAASYRTGRGHRQKIVTIGLILAVITCMILICTLSYSSIKAQANTGFKYYTGVIVENGETLWSIADRYIDYEHYKDKAAYIAEVEQINHMDAEETLLTGQLLIVPYYSAEFVP